jgi:CheY-like chemotaxis protein
LPRIPRPPADPRATPLNDTPSPPRDAVSRPTVRTTTAAPAPASAPAAAEDPAATARLLETILRELKAVREGQEEILSRLGRSREETASDGPPSLGLHFDDAPAAEPPPVRARRRKTVLLVDDDPATLAAARAALDAAEVPVRTATDGNAALSAIAEEKPDVIVMELDMRGSMAGKDVINMIKATMEWVDLPIVLYTRAAIESQKEARTVHGADEFVLKQAGPEALVARVITVFRKP